MSNSHETISKEILDYLIAQVRNSEIDTEKLVVDVCPTSNFLLGIEVTLHYTALDFHRRFYLDFPYDINAAKNIQIVHNQIGIFLNEIHKRNDRKTEP